MKRTDIGLVSCNFENYLIHKIDKDMQSNNHKHKHKKSVKLKHNSK